MGCTAEAAKCVVHLGRSYPGEDPSCSGLVPTAKTTLNPAHVRPERRALHKEPRLDDTITAAGMVTPLTAHAHAAEIDVAEVVHAALALNSPLTKCLFSRSDGRSACSRRSELGWRCGRREP